MKRISRQTNDAVAVELVSRGKLYNAILAQDDYMARSVFVWSDEEIGIGQASVACILVITLFRVGK